MKHLIQLLLIAFVATGCQSTSPLERLKKDPDFRGYDPEIQRPYAGNIKGEITITLYSDFQCPACRDLDHHLLLAVAAFTNVKLIRHEFPLDGNCNKLLIYQKIMGKNLHDYGCQSAALALCKPELYWQVHDYLYEHQRLISPELLQKAAEHFKIAPKAASACTDLKGEAIRAIRKQINATLKQHPSLNRTPYIIINKKKVLWGDHSVKYLKKEILDAGGKVH